jgi:ABC-type glutathione transport system ATPase component
VTIALPVPGSPSSPIGGDPLLAVEGLSRHFRLGRSGLFGQRPTVKAVDEVSFSINKGEVLGIVGESGCGKSSVAKAILNIHPPQSGSVRLNNTELTKLSAAAWRQMRRKIQYVFQDPLSALDPRMKVLDQVMEPLIIHDLGTGQERAHKARGILDAVGLGATHFAKFPHELSGGQQQRVVLARALVLEPEIILCDEPISALDVSIQAQVVNLLQELRAEVQGLGSQAQQSFTEGNAGTYRDLAEILIAQGRLAEARQILDLLKEEEFFDFLVHGRTHLQASPLPQAIPAPTMSTRLERQWAR